MYPFPSFSPDPRPDPSPQTPVFLTCRMSRGDFAPHELRLIITQISASFPRPDGEWGLATSSLNVFHRPPPSTAPPLPHTRFAGAQVGQRFLQSLGKIGKAGRPRTWSFSFGLSCTHNCLGRTGLSGLLRPGSRAEEQPEAAQEVEPGALVAEKESDGPAVRPAVAVASARASRLPAPNLLRPSRETACSAR